MASLHTYLEDTYGDGIQYAFRHFPLSFHDKATPAAEAAEAAGAQGKFFEMHDLLFARQQEWAALSGADLEARLVEYAGELGLDTDQFAQELKDHTHLPNVQADLAEATGANLSGTPSYIINGIEYPVNEIGLSPAQVVAFIHLLDWLPNQYTQVPPSVTEAGQSYLATITTSKGEVVVELYPDQAPTNVNNFAFLAQDGYFDGQSFFYVDPASAAYAGDPTNMGWGLAFPGYYCGDEISTDLTFDEPGMVAFYAPSPGRNSNLFFITTVARPDYNGKFTIIGQVSEGLDVVQALTATTPGGPAPDTLESIAIEKR
jgi:cyclophilin family peptidyl-prolyl cis-trans isomerase